MDQAQRILNAPILIAGENISGMSADKAGPTADRAPSPSTARRSKSSPPAVAPASRRYAWRPAKPWSISTG